MKNRETAAGKIKKTIGRSEVIALPELGFEKVPARIDTGAKTTSVWASGIVVSGSKLQFVLFDKQSALHTGQVITVGQFEEVVVASSIGEPQQRYRVKMLIKLKGKKVRARVTLADRSQQTYPVLIGRNVLRGKFIVDVQGGKPLYKEERSRSQSLQSRLGAKD